MTQSNAVKAQYSENHLPNFLRESGEKIVIKTKSWGEIEVFSSQIFSFPEGILGFNFIDSFAFLQEDSSPFMWMQAISEPDLSFVVIEPESFMDSYDLAVSQNDIDCIGEKSIDNIKVLFIVTIPEKTSDMTANLQGPIILNLQNKTGKQSISLSDKYKTRHSILEELNKRGK